jgi:hypothetical protein
MIDVMIDVMIQCGKIAKTNNSVHKCFKISKKNIASAATLSTY